MLVAASCAATAAPESPTDPKRDGYYYWDCGNDDFTPPLINCATLRVTSSLDAVYVGGRFDEGLSTEPDKNYWIVRSREVPIAIPKERYEKQDNWTFGGRKYVKVKKGIPTLNAGETTDVIAVVGNIDKIKGIEYTSDISSYDLLTNLELTFWYSTSRGVEAIGVPGGRGAKEVYFCVRKPCLFAPRK